MRWLAVVAFVACSGNERPRLVTPTASSARRTLDADATFKTRGGATVRVARGWVVTEGEVLVLEDPEHSSTAWFVEIEEHDATKAIATAWKRVQKDALPIASTDVPPPGGGWDSITDVSYATTGTRVIRASARRFGDITYVVLVDSDRSTMSRRGPQLEAAIASLHPAGMVAETLAGRTVRSIDAKALDTFIDGALTRLEVPGAAVAVVKDGAVVYERAFGVRVLGKPAKVTPQTLFMIASVTKTMTTLMEATLVDAKVLEWTTPIASIYPSFALGDAALTEQLLVWHTSCACTGMPRSDLENIFEYGNVSAEQRLAGMKTMKPTTALGETFQYSNLMLTAGGYIAAHALSPKLPLGDAYDIAMKKQVFEPTGMTATTLDFAVALKGEHALPHAPGIDGVVREVPIGMEKNVVPIRPAGGVWTNLRDMERYVMMELAGGIAPGGKRVVSEENLHARWKRRVGDEADGYGLGISVGTYAGVPEVDHDGGAFGFGSTMFMLPDQRIGIIILTNVRNGSPTEHLPFNTAVKRRVIEELFEGTRPLAATQVEYFANGKAAAVPDVSFTFDAERLKRIAGAYTNDMLGTVTLTPTTDGMMFDVGEWKRLVKQQTMTDGALVLIHVDPPFAGAAFTIVEAGAAPTFTLEYAQSTYLFTRHRASN